METKEKKILEEVILRKKKDQLNKERVSERNKSRLMNKKRNRDKSNDYLSAQKAVKNFREKHKSYIGFKRKMAASNKIYKQNFDSNYLHKPIIVIRICGQWSRISNEIQIILKKLNLNNLFNAVILYYNEDNFKLIKLIESYITWGYINKANIEGLLTKRGCYIAGANEENILDNTEIEKSLGKYGIFCIEDLVYQLLNEGKYGLHVLNYIGYFKLENKEGGFEKVNIPYHKNGSQGFRGEDINLLLKKMI